MSVRIYSDKFVPKYESGRWKFSKSKRDFRFIRNSGPSHPKSQFKTSITQAEEVLFIEKFRRPVSSRDNHVITIQDIKDVVLFLASSNLLSSRFVDFLHTETVDEFLNALVIYFEYFFQIMEFIVIRRDETNRSGCERKIRNDDSDFIECMISEYIVQYRIMLARSYAKILLGEKELASYHHMANKINKSYTEIDCSFMETFFACCKQFVWIAMHRRLFNEIDYEFDRLFRSNDFQIARKQSVICCSLAIHEKLLLYGKSEKNVYKLIQKSPLISQLLGIKPKHLELLWIGEYKYEGNDPRVLHLEYEYVIPDAQLVLADVQHGILGHPKKIYNTLLVLDWSAIRKEKYSKNNDPFRLFRQPHLVLPDWREFGRTYRRVGHQYKLINRKYDKESANCQRIAWRNKQKYLNEATDERVLRDIYREAEECIKQ